jgi:cellulose synthase/poly-beta-1,6-N-acetylglucosamine synthase-like glycosyltransferase
MITVLAAMLFGLVLVVYCIQIIRYFLVLTPLRTGARQHPSIDHGPGISVLVPYRNEEMHLSSLVADLKAQDYPSELIEFIFINDHSSDSSSVVLKKLTSGDPAFRLLELPENQQGKKQAILYGATRAKHEWIVQTDADCRMGTGWLRSMMRPAAGSALPFIAGPVRLNPAGRLWNRLEALEFLAFGAVTSASFNLERPVMCNGANLAYPRNLLLDHREEYTGADTPSGDDVFLLQTAHRMGMRMVMVNEPKAMVVAAPAGSPRAFLRQRIRWGSKARLYRNGTMRFITLLIFSGNLSLVAFLAMTIPGWIPVYLFAGAWCIKTFSEFLLLSRWSVISGQQKVLFPFPLVALFYYFYIVITGTASLFSGYTWKGRNY